MGLYLRFERVCEALETHGGNLDFLQFFSEYQHPNENHVALAMLAKAGATLLTTNFDGLVEIAAHQLHYDLKVVNLTDGECSGLSPNALYKLHGSITASNYEDSDHSVATTIKSVSNPHLTKRLNSFLQTALQNKHLIVMGYSGFDDFDVSPALVSIVSSKRLIWLNHDSSQHSSPSPQVIGGLDQKSKPKSMILCEKLIARAARSPENVEFINCHTGQVLASLSGQMPKTIKDHSSINVDYQGHIKRWADINLNDIKRRCISMDLLTTLQQYSRAHALLINLSDIRLPIDGIIPAQKHLLLRYLSCLIASPSMITESDVDYAVAQCGTVKKCNHSDIDLLTNLGNLLQVAKKTDLAVQCFQHASHLIQFDEDSEQKLRTVINLSVALNPQQFSNRPFVEALVARAESCSALRLLPNLLYHLADDDHPTYYLRTIDAAALIGDRDYFIRAAVSSFNLTDKYRPLLMALHADSGFFESIAERDPQTYILFCPLAARYLCDASLPGVAEVAMRGWSLLEAHPLGTLENKAYYAAELIDNLKRAGVVEVARSFLENNFANIDSLPDTLGKFYLLARRYSLAPSIEASASAKSFAMQCIERARKDGESWAIAAALTYLNDTNNALTCFEIANDLLQTQLLPEVFSDLAYSAGVALFNLGRLSEAKYFFLLPYHRFPGLRIDHSSLLFNLARIELAQNNLEAATRLLLCSDELGDKTFYSVRSALRDRLKQRMSEPQFAQLAHEIALKMRYATDHDLCVREILASKGLFNAD